MTDEFEAITEEWLKAVGFRWDEWPRSGGKHWTLWFGNLQDRAFSSFEDLGIEVAQIHRADSSEWNCWIRSDFASKYGRFIHLRYISHRVELIAIVEALTAIQWNPANHLHGAIRTSKEAQYIAETALRPDRVIMRGSKWAEHEKDSSQSRPSVHED